MSKGFYEDYHPAPVPYDLKEIPRYLDDELHRIHEQKEPRSAKAIWACAQGTAGFVIEPPPGTWNQLFIGCPSIIDLPPGWDSATGNWTAPYTGVYECKLEFQFVDITDQGQGTIHIYAGIGSNGANPPEHTRTVAVPLGIPSAIVSLHLYKALDAGETVQFWGEAVNEGTQSQTCNISAGGSIIRLT